MSFSTLISSPLEPFKVFNLLLVFFMSRFNGKSPLVGVKTCKSSLILKYHDECTMITFLGSNCENIFSLKNLKFEYTQKKGSDPSSPYHLLLFIDLGFPCLSRTCFNYSQCVQLINQDGILSWTILMTYFSYQLTFFFLDEIKNIYIIKRENLISVDKALAI